MFSKTIQPKSSEQIDAIRESGKFLTELLYSLYDLCKPWIQTMELELYAEKFMITNNIAWAFKGYNWFPANLCLSNNDCVVHGIPGDEILKDGDVLKVDCGINFNGGISDAAFSIVIWWNDKNLEWSKLIKGTKKALDESIKVIKPWVVWRTFGRYMQQALYDEWISIIKNLTGHGVWSDVHEPPHIYNRPQNSMKKRNFIEWMVCAIEPITAISSEAYKEKPWNARNLYTEYGDLGAQWEYTLVVTKGGVEILAWIQEL